MRLPVVFVVVILMATSTAGTKSAAKHSSAAAELMNLIEKLTKHKRTQYDNEGYGVVASYQEFDGYGSAYGEDEDAEGDDDTWGGYEGEDQGEDWGEVQGEDQGDDWGEVQDEDQGDDQGDNQGLKPAWSDANFPNSAECQSVSPAGEKYTQASIATDDLPVRPNCGNGRGARGLLELLRPERIVGGQESRHGQWPWLAAIGTKSEGQECGATLISDQWVLTAAHCFEETVKPCEYNVRLGEHNLLAQEGKHVDITPSKIISHPNYDKETMANDVALIKLSHRVSMSEYVNVACLPDNCNDIHKTSCVVAGWGFLRDAGQSSNVVMHVSAPLLSKSVCKQSYPGQILDGMMCAGHLTGGKDSCQGDSGGPLMCKSKSSGRYTVAGVVSWGKACAEAGFPGIYADVIHYMDWVEWVISKN